MTSAASPRLVTKNHVRKEMEEGLEVIASGRQLIPRFAIQYPEGLYRMLVQLPDDETERYKRFAYIKEWLACDLVLSFIFTSETKRPDALASVAVSRHECVVGITQIDRTKHAPTGDVSWHGTEVVDEVLLDMLSTGGVEVKSERKAELAKHFSLEGSFPFFPMAER